MEKDTSLKTFEDRIVFLLKQAAIAPISVKDMLAIFSGKGRSLALIFLSLPFCQPLQIPGFSIVFGFAIACIGLRIVFGRRLWLPKGVLSKTISFRLLKKIGGKSLWVIKKYKRFIHPRLDRMVHNRFMRVINGLLVFLLGIILALPLPIPFSNLMAAWSILLIGIAMLEDDGLVLFIGYLMSLLTFGFITMLGLSVKFIEMKIEKH